MNIIRKSLSFGMAFLLGFSSVIFSCQKKEPVDLRIQQMDGEKVRRMATEIEASVTPTLKEGLSMKLWAVDSLIVDPISIQIGEDGTLYYSSSGRKPHAEFDIRGHQNWEIASISLQSIEDKRAFLHKELAPERSEYNNWLPDMNGDGSHDWRDLTVPKERIYRVRDTDGDGLADWSQIMVEDFSDEVTDVAGAVHMHEDNLYVGVGPDMWRLQDQNGDGLMDSKTSLSHGYAIHIGFGAHGMSGARMGPDGRLYWAVGDVGFNGTDQDGKQWKYPNRGVVVRSNPDGSDFEVFAMGVRNTHEFVFDEYNNLISVDNDGDHRGESERLVYLVNGSDTGWRINWQFGKYRDPDNNTYKVWMDEGLDKPRHEGQAAYITPAIANYINGPTGMLYNPGTALSPRWKNTFFVVEFVGNPAKSGIHAFKLKPNGATFELAETEMIQSGMLPTGLDFGPDGAMYAADWINGWGNKNYGRIWKFDDDEGADWAARKETHRLIVLDYSKMSEDELHGHLGYEDMRIRRKAQFELAKRGDKGARVFENVLNHSDNQLARIHAIVGISQLARMETMDYAKILIPLLKDSDPEIRAQAAKWLGDIKFKEAGQHLLALLVDENPRAQFFAAEAIGRVAYAPAFPSLIALFERNEDEDAYIRHAASLALARMAQPGDLAKLAGHYSKSVRLGAVLALRRMEHPSIEIFLNDGDEYIVTEVARAINDDFSIESALPALGNLLITTSFTNEPLIRRAINANLRVGSEEAMQNLIAYMQRNDLPEVLRKEAIEALGTWTKPSVLDRVDGRYRGEVNRSGELVRRTAQKSLTELLGSGSQELKIAAALAMGRLNMEDTSEALLNLSQRDRAPEVRIAAIQALAKMNVPETELAIERSIADSDKNVRVAGLTLLNQLDLDKDLKVKLLSEVIQNQTTEEKQAALVSLGKLPIDTSRETFESLIERMGSGNLPEAILLELSEAVENTEDANLNQKYQLAAQERWGEDELASYQSSLNGGDEIKGQQIFFQSQSGQCMRCHAYDDMGGIVGPKLNGIGRELSRQELLESLIAPSKRIAPGYGIVMLELEDGANLNGVLEKETNDALHVRIGGKPDTLIQKSNIATRRDAASSMPDMKEVLSRREIRDLVSFLVTLTEDYNPE